MSGQVFKKGEIGALEASVNNRVKCLLDTTHPAVAVAAKPATQPRFLEGGVDSELSWVFVFVPDSASWMRFSALHHSRV